MTLAFKVTGQRLTWKQQQQEISRPFVVADSRNYLKASFDFSDDWVGNKTAVFTKWDGTVYHMLLEQGVCTVPAEVIAAPHFTVSVFGGDRITANVLTVAVEKSGCVEGETPPAPTPDVYEQLLTQVKTITAQAMDAAAASAEEAKVAASEADATAGLVTQMKNVVFAHMTTASEVSGNASDARDAAETFRDDAAICANEAYKSELATLTAKDEAVKVAADAQKAREDTQALRDQTSTLQQSVTTLHADITIKYPQVERWAAEAEQAATTCTDILAQVEALTGITAEIKATLGVE